MLFLDVFSEIGWFDRVDIYIILYYLDNNYYENNKMFMNNKSIISKIIIIIKIKYDRNIHNINSFNNYINLNIQNFYFFIYYKI